MTGKCAAIFHIKRDTTLDITTSDQLKSRLITPLTTEIEKAER